MSPQGITTDGANLYVTDRHVIRRIALSINEVSTFAGSGPGSADGTGLSASFNLPQGITTDGTHLYVADSENSRIRKILISSGEVTTPAGSGLGYTDGTGSAGKF